VTWTRPRPPRGWRCIYCCAPFRSRVLRAVHIRDFHERQSPKRKGWKIVDAKRAAFHSRKDLGFN
jgi:hypothetical protein